MLEIFRKKKVIENEELDLFLDNKSVSTKYYVEKNYLNNKVFKYLLLLRYKGVNLNKFFDDEMQKNEDLKTFKKHKL